MNLRKHTSYSGIKKNKYLGILLTKEVPNFKEAKKYEHR